MSRSLTDFFLFWRTLVSRDHEVVDAVVQPAHTAPSPELREALSQFPGVHYWDDADGARRLVLIRPLAAPPRERWWLHSSLFAVTFFTVWMGGAFLAGADPTFAGPAPSLRDLGAAAARWVATLRPGLEFAMGLMAILLAHETGHYLTAKRYGLNVSPPYFLPAPPVWPFLYVGTFGAFIRLRSPVVDRRQLLDVGAAGPWTGFLVAMIVLVAGLLLSERVDTGREAAQFIMVGRTSVYLGDSLIMGLARRLFAGDGAILLHPLAFAGWLGLFVTMLNLLPLGQLDGGHVLYGLVGRAQRWIAWFTWFGLLALGFKFWGWFVWAAFTILLGRGRLTHPSVLDRHRRIPLNRRPLGWATVALFVATFTPVPFYE